MFWRRSMRQADPRGQPWQSHAGVIGHASKFELTEHQTTQKSMSSPRRRRPRSSSPRSSREGQGPPSPVLVNAVLLDAASTRPPKQSKRKNLWIFVLGSLFGIVLVGFFAQSNDFIDLSVLANLEGMSLDNLMEVLPAAFVRDAQQLQVRGTHGLYPLR